MASEPLPDHFKALGIDRSADAATIKATYRKLVLKCHPDKVTDPALKEQKQEEFHKIQQAYEVLVDDEKRAQYEAHLTLESLRKDTAARRAAASGGEKTARFDVPTRGATMRANGPSRYTTEERRPTARSYDEDEKYYDAHDRSARSGSKYDTYPAYPKSGATAAPQSKREKESSSKSSRSASDRTRSDRNKTRDKEQRSERKFMSVETDSSADEKVRYEENYKRRSADEERRQADMRRSADDRRKYDEPSRYAQPSSARRMSEKEEEAIRYQHKSRAQVDVEMRPATTRTSSRDHYHTDSRSSRKDSRPETVRRSSAARTTKDRTTSSSARERERSIPEIVDWGSDRRPPTMKHATSSPANIEIPITRSMPQRAYTEAPREHRSSHSPPPGLYRSATMPNAPHPTSSRRKEAPSTRPSTLREAMSPERGSPEREYPTVPPPQPASASKTKHYYYPSATGGVTLRPEDISAGGHRTILREPERQRHRSPSPLSRPPIGPNRPSEANISAKQAPLPPRQTSPVRGRSERPLYGEMGTSDYQRARARGQPTNYSPDSVQFTKRYGPEDVRWAPRSRENDSPREFSNKPTLGRTATFVY